jgi:hypothetical protein
MTDADEMGRSILRNKLLGRWAAEMLGKTGADAQAYADRLAEAALTPEGSDVFTTIRRDFDAAGVSQSDEQILGVMNDLTIKAGKALSMTGGASPDAAAAMLVRRLAQ